MANNKTQVKIGAFEQKLQEMEAGITKVIPQGSTLVVERSPQTAAQMADRLKAYLQMFADARDKKYQARRQIGALHQKLPEAHQYYMDLKTTLVAFFGRGSPELSQFGISVRQRKPLTSEQKAVAHAKALNTRKVRHTLGRKQHLAQDAVPTVVVVGADGKPISGNNETAPAAPTPAPAGGGSK
jgi:hypothetical protein